MSQSILPLPSPVDAGDLNRRFAADQSLKKMTFCGRFAIGSAQPEGVQDLVGSSDFLKIVDQRPFRCSFAPARPSETEQLLEITPDKERSKLMQLINHQFADPSRAYSVLEGSTPERHHRLRHKRSRSGRNAHFGRASHQLSFLAPNSPG
ncbi:hypothetical protein T4D_11220 [Trichinella pseudospiralis]|uniref:Uncharacterized protein n=1 Tax=Trichinella pseudospiralis TaxID=6337 RepID=A0A0V1FZE0_TRIPS|nr:hypothetical protein T4D_11220 [Trichinella pseudospiralis]